MLDVGEDVMAASRRLHRAFDALDQAAADLLATTREELRCLILLEPGPLPPRRVGPALGMSPRRGAELLLRLERRGLVERTRDPGDRRGALVSSTPEVWAGIGGLYRTCADGLRGTLAGYGAAERDDAVRHLDEAAAALEAATDAFCEA